MLTMGRPKKRLPTSKFGRKLYRWRVSNGWTQAEAAKKLGVNWRTFVRWENGERLPRTTVQILIDLLLK